MTIPSGTAQPRTGFPAAEWIASGVGAGVLGALLGVLAALTATWGAPPGVDDLAFSLGPELRRAIVVRSLGLFALLGGLAGALAGVVLFALLRRVQRVLGVILGVGVGGGLFLYLSALGQLDRLVGLPLDHPARWRLALVHGVVALGVGLVAGLVTARFTRSWRPGPRLGGWVALSIVLVLTLSWVLFRGAEPSPGPTARGAVVGPQRIVVVGLDGLTFRILGPMARAGELPTFARLMDEGAWGPLMTYGTASSPRVWTTLATGRKTRVHGIDDFVRAGGRYRATALRSTDRRAPALWNILGDAGRRVAVVDWLMTFPPERVNGVLVTRLADRRPSSYPPERVKRLDTLAEPLPSAADDEQAHRLGMVDRVFGVAEELLRDEPDFLALYDNAADAAQHRQWRDHQPEVFGPVWGPADDTRATWVADVYRQLDRRLGRLVEGLGPETLVVVVSDHGQRAASRPRIRLRLDRLLAELGYLELDSAGRPVYERSRAYPLVETLWTPTLRLGLNLEGREPQGIVPRRRAGALLDRLERDLGALRLGDDGPLFERIERAEGAPRPRGGADFELVPTARLRQLAAEGSVLEVAGARLPGADFVALDRTISGEHDHRGVLIVHGPGARPGFYGQRTLSTPAHRLLWHLTDKVDAVDGLLPVLRWLGLTDPATTLDLTPTVLALGGLPIGRDMPGRPLVELFDDLGPSGLVATYQGADAEPEEPADEEPADEEMIERLEALGYVS